MFVADRPVGHFFPFKARRGYSILHNARGYCFLGNPMADRSGVLTYSDRVSVEGAPALLITFDKFNTHSDGKSIIVWSTELEKAN